MHCIYMHSLAGKVLYGRRSDIDRGIPTSRARKRARRFLCGTDSRGEEHMKFESVSIILPTLRETGSFVETVSTILNTNRSEDIKEFIAVVCDKTKQESFSSIEEARKISESAGVPLRILYQTIPYFGGALRDGFDAAIGSHCCMVTPDRETAPDRVSDMIALAKEYPGDIISASRWRKGGGFENYSKFKKVWNYFSQVLLKLLYLSSLTDFTWSVQIAPTVLCQSLNYQETKHPITVERVVIPLRLGIKFHEISGIIYMPEDDETVNPMMANLAYLRPAFRWRFARREKLLKEGVDEKWLKQELKEDKS